MRVTRTHVEYVTYFLLAGLSLLPASFGRHPRLVNIVVRPLLLSGGRILCSAEVPRPKSDPRLSIAAAPTRGHHLRRAVRVLARSSASCRRLRYGRCSGDTGCSQRLPLDDAMPGNHGQPAVIHAGVCRWTVLYDC